LRVDWLDRVQRPGSSLRRRAGHGRRLQGLAGRDRLRDARVRSSGPEREPDPGRLLAVRL